MTVTVTTSLVKEFKATMQALIKKNVYVGIPEDNTKRENIETKDGSKPSPVTNAQLGYLHENGSEGGRIPARPFLKPGVEQAGPEVARILGQAAITTGTSAQDVDIALEKVGQRTRDIVKNRIRQSTDIQGLSEATKYARAHRKKNRRTGVMKPLIDSSQMINSITYVIRDE